MAADGRKESLCDLLDVVAFGHNEQWLPKGAAKVCTKLAGAANLAGMATLAANLLLLLLLHITLALAPGGRMAPGWSSGCSLSEDEDLTNGPVYDDDDYMEIFNTSIP